MTVVTIVCESFGVWSSPFVSQLLTTQQLKMVCLVGWRGANYCSVKLIISSFIEICQNGPQALHSLFGEQYKILRFCNVVR